MCGITGMWSLQPQEDDVGVVQRMSDVIAHRGPDDAGLWSEPASGVTFGFRRLAIVDLSAEGHQPMGSASGRFEIAFNGEIYNFRELREQLERQGRHFRGHSDTEVALAAFEIWGVNASLCRFVGMFAMAIWDHEAQRLYLVRDRLGEKPLYYGVHHGRLVFASELKCLCQLPRWSPVVDRRALLLYLRHGYVPAPYAIYEGFAKVRPGTMQVVDRTDDGFTCRETTYWDPRTVAESARTNPVKASEGDHSVLLEHELRRTIREQMVADVPVGAFLSGGIDSSLVVSLMQAEGHAPVRTFTIGFEDKAYNEAEYADAVARHLGTEHTALCVTASDLLSVVPRLPHIYDEPFADSSQIPTFLVSELAHRHVTVSLSGDGGDELFGGYPRYLGTERLWSRVGSLPRPLRTAAGRALRLVPRHLWDRVIGQLGQAAGHGFGGPVSGARIHRLAELLGTPSREALYHSGVSAWSTPFPTVSPIDEYPSVLTDAGRRPRLASFLEEMMWMDATMYLPDDLMVKVDRASMAVSLETRAPFLDHRIVELAWRLPIDDKVHHGRGKQILRDILDRHVPRRLIEREKMGFGVPLGEWLRGPLRQWASDLLAPDRLRAEGFFDAEVIGREWDDHLHRRRERAAQLWTVLMFQAWLETQSHIS